MTETTRRPYRGVSADDRQQARRTALQDAGWELLAETGPDALSIRAVSERAGLTRRYFYQNYLDLDALLVDLFDVLSAQVMTAVVVALETTPDEVGRQVRAVLHGTIGAVTDHPGKARLALAAATAPGALGRRRSEATDAMVALVGAAVRPRWAEHGIPERVTDTAVIMLVGGVTELVGRWLAGSLDASLDQLVEDCAGVVELGARLITVRPTPR